MPDPTRVTPYLGGTGANNQGRINVHASLHRVTIGGDATANSNLHVIGSAAITGGLELGWNVVSANATMSPGNRYAANTSSGSFLLRLPTTAPFGTSIVVADVF